MWTKQNLQSLGVLLLSLLFVLGITPSVAYEPRGLVYPLGSVAEDVKVVAPGEVSLFNKRPYGAKIIGKVTAEIAVQGSKGSEKHSQLALLQYAQKQAGKLGANGLVVEAYGSQGKTLLIEGFAIEQ